MPRKLHYLTLERVLEAHSWVLKETGGERGMLSRGNLEYVIEAVRRRRGGLFYKAAFLLHGIATAHPFVNGNKRVAFTITSAFLEANGRVLSVGWNEGLQFMLDVTQERFSLDRIAKWLARHSRKK